MDSTQLNNFRQLPQPLISHHKDSNDSLLDSMVCDSSSRLITTGFTRNNNADGGEYFMFVNAGGESFSEADGEITFLGDTYFNGGNVFHTDEQIVGAGDYPFIYQSARLGSFCYRLTLKAKECYEAWMSLTTTNEQLEATQMELDKVTFKSLTIDQTLEKQAEDLRSISSRYELDKKKWAEAIRSLQEKVKCEDLKVKYNEQMTQRKKLFNEVQEAKDGYNCCTFAYGQTGTGKTFTMEGLEHNRGVNYRTLELLFKISKERSQTFAYDISVSVLEVYNEQIRDLLATGPASKRLEIKQASEGSRPVPGVIDAKVDNISEVWNVLQAGSNARAVGSNNINEHSSRSHCILCIMVRAKNLMSGECTKSKLWLVDLAGSERLTRTDVQGERLKEAQNINRSLSALGDVISALAAKSSHIPYRNSKLTHLLQDSLGGDSKTLMFVQISPSEQDVSETLSSLNFATRVRGVELGPVKKQIDTGELQKVKTMARTSNEGGRAREKSERTTAVRDSKLSQKVLELEKKLKGHLQGSESQSAILKEKVKELERKLKEQDQSSELFFYRQQVKELERKLKEQDQSSELSFYREQVMDLEKKLKEQEQSSELSLLHQQVKELEDRCREQQSHCFVEAAKATPDIGKDCKTSEECLSEIEPHILKTSNSSICQINQGSTFSKGNNDSTHQIRTKRDLRSNEIENNYVMSSSLHKRKVTRKSDPPMVGRGVKPTTKSVITTQPPLSHKRVSTNRDIQGIKERDSKNKIWNR
ncbi:unnamed protein product [Lupinus luteus]|uniref:Kinesin-like protein n=1 Tax=Lupinus luteus TaxID=3873 RepID=A0AAV1WRA5_LUPLU